VYTPELVVGGRVGMVGSNTQRVVRAIANAPHQIAVSAHATWSKTSVTVEAKAPEGADVFVAIWQDGTRTKVPAGENAGRMLAGDRVVRRLEHIAAPGTSATREIRIDPAWCKVGAVAFAQKPDRSIIGATILR
jgi:hypothetical protein